jgi:hypothetical protein
MKNLLTLSILIVAILISFYTLYIPPNIRFNAEIPSYVSPKPLPFLASNSLLSTAQFSHNGLFKGPEHFAFYGPNELYFGVSDGRILRIIKDNDDNFNLTLPETICHTGLTTEELQAELRTQTSSDEVPVCGQHKYEVKCGRPLGMTFAPENYRPQIPYSNLVSSSSYRPRLIVADNIGFFEIDVDTGSKLLLFDNFEGQPFNFPNSLTFGHSGTLYFTDSTNRFPRSEYVYDILEGSASGRLFAYDSHSRTLSLLATQIGFANGILVYPPVEPNYPFQPLKFEEKDQFPNISSSETEQYIIVSELSRARLLQFDLSQYRTLRQQLIDTNIVTKHAPKQYSAAYDIKNVASSTILGAKYQTNQYPFYLHWSQIVAHQHIPIDKLQKNRPVFSKLALSTPALPSNSVSFRRSLLSILSIAIDNLACIPDNLAWSEKLSQSPHFYIGCGSARKAPFSLMDSLNNWPSIRNVLAYLVPKKMFLSLVPRIGFITEMELILPSNSGENRPIIREVATYQDRSGRLFLLTGAYERGNWFYLGCIGDDADYLIRIAKDDMKIKHEYQI